MYYLYRLTKWHGNTKLFKKFLYGVEKVPGRLTIPIIIELKFYD